jgi:hypothetical protein
MPRKGGCRPRVPEEEEGRSPSLWSSLSVAAWLASSAGVMWGRCSVGEQQRGKGDHGFVDVQRRIDSTTRLTTSKRPTGDSPLAPPSFTSE